MRQVGERLDVACQVSECPVYSDALLVHISAAAAAAAAGAAGAHNGAAAGAPALGGGGEREAWTALSLRFTQRCFSDGDSPALLFHQRWRRHGLPAGAAWCTARAPVLAGLRWPGELICC